MEFEEKIKEIKEHFGELIDDDVAIMLAEYYFGKKYSFKKIGFFAYCNGEKTVILRDSQEVYEGLVNAKKGQKVEILIQNGKIKEYVAFNDFRNIFTPLSDLKPERYYCVRGFVSGIGGMKKVRNNREIAIIKITDKKSFATLVFWDDKIEYYRKVDIGDELLLYNVFVNKFGDEINIHAGKNSFIEIKKLF